MACPNLDDVGDVQGIASIRLSNLNGVDQIETKHLIDKTGPSICTLSICTDQTNFQKMASRMLPSGSMESNPLHAMSSLLQILFLARYLDTLVLQNIKKIYLFSFPSFLVA